MKYREKQMSRLFVDRDCEIRGCTRGFQPNAWSEFPVEICSKKSALAQINAIFAECWAAL